MIFFSIFSLPLRIDQLLSKITSLSLIYLGLYFYLWSRNLFQCFKFAFVYRVGVKEFYNMFYRVVHYGFFTFFSKPTGWWWRWWFTRSWCITPLRYVKGTTTSHHHHRSEITIHVNHIKFPFEQIHSRTLYENHEILKTCQYE